MQATEHSELPQGLFLTGVLGDETAPCDEVKKEVDEAPSSPPAVDSASVFDETASSLPRPEVKEEGPSSPVPAEESTSMLDFLDLVDIDVSKPLFVQETEAPVPEEETKDISNFLIDFSSFQIFVSELCSEKLKSEVSDAYLKTEDQEVEDISSVLGSLDGQQQWTAAPQPIVPEPPPQFVSPEAPLLSPAAMQYYPPHPVDPYAYIPASAPLQNIEMKVPQFASEAPAPVPHLPHQYAANYYVVALPPNGAQFPLPGTQTGVYWQTMAPAPPSRNRRRPRVCSVCNKTCKNPYELKLHMNSHTGAKPYVCKVCGAAYSHYSSLSTHRRDKGHVKRALEN